MDEEEPTFDLEGAFERESRSVPTPGPTPADVARAMARAAKSSGGMVPVSVSTGNGGVASSGSAIVIGSGGGGAGGVPGGLGQGIAPIPPGMSPNAPAQSFDWRFVRGDTKLLFADINATTPIVTDVLCAVDPSLGSRYGMLTDVQLATLHGMLDTALRLVMKEQRERYQDEYEPPKVGPVLKKRPQS